MLYYFIATASIFEPCSIALITIHQIINSLRASPSKEMLFNIPEQTG
ncbi:Uncharacterised protein [Yersinia enterocolitica]|nr:Uncharacterised protein [Yersinia enterocolitica]